MTLQKNTRVRNHIMEILLPFFVVLEPYRISILPMTAVLLFAIFLFRKDDRIFFSKKSAPFFAFFGYMVLRDLMHMFFSVSGPIGSQINRLIESSVLYLLIFLVCNDDFDEDRLFSSWKVAGVIFGAGMIYHVFLLLVLGQKITPISLIPGYDISHDIGMQYDRPCSFFSEPAAYVISMMPLLFLALRKRDFKWAAIATFLIVISTSTVGVILCAVLWISFILLEKKSWKITLFSLLFVAAFTLFMLNSPIFTDTMQKMQDVSEGESTWQSRVEGPFQMVGAMDWTELPFGTKLLDYKQFVHENYDELAYSIPFQRISAGANVFLNTVAHLIFRYGLVGLFFFFLLFQGKIFVKNHPVRMYAIMLLVAAFGQGSIASPSIPLILLLLYANKGEKELENQKKVF